MISYLKKNKWSSYVVGFLLALLSLFSFIAIGNMLGSSTTFVYLAALLLNLIAPQYVENNHYLAAYLQASPVVNWQFALLVGLFIGAYVASRLTGPVHAHDVPPIWKKRFGSNKWFRYLGAFIGGIFVLFGARLADGCTSGNAITGGMQLAVSGWIFMGSLFVVGIPTAFLLYRTGGKA